MKRPRLEQDVERLLERLETLRDIDRAEQQIAAGKGIPYEVARDQILTACVRLTEGYQAFEDILPSLDFEDESKWGSPIEDPEDYLRRELLRDGEP